MMESESGRGEGVIGLAVPQQRRKSATVKPCKRAKAKQRSTINQQHHTCENVKNSTRQHNQEREKYLEVGPAFHVVPVHELLHPVERVAVSGDP